MCWDPREELDGLGRDCRVTREMSTVEAGSFSHWECFIKVTEWKPCFKGDAMSHGR